MTYTKVSSKKPHKCDPLPHPTRETVGTVLKCDECGKKYRLVTREQHGESWSEWERTK